MSDDSEYSNSAALFKRDPDEVKSKNHPSWSGKFQITCPECGCASEGYLDAWVKNKESVTGGKFFSIAMKFKEKRRAQAKKSRQRDPGEDDDI